MVEIGLLKAITIRIAGFSHVAKDQGDVILPRLSLVCYLTL